MAELQAGEGEMQMTITVTRAATGKTEEYILTAIPEPETAKEEEKE